MGVMDRFISTGGQMTFPNTGKNRALLRAALHFSDVHVRFIKADSSERVMHATTSPKLIPTEERERLQQVHSERRDNDEVIRVWDIEKQAWRSFRFDSIIEVW